MISAMANSIRQAGRRPRTTIWIVALVAGLVVWAMSWAMDRSSRYYSGSALEELVERPAHRYDRIATSIAAARAMVYLDRVERGEWHVLMDGGRLSGVRRGDTTVPMRSTAIRMGATFPDRPVTAYLVDDVLRPADRFEYRLEGSGSPVISIPVDSANCTRVLWSIALDPMLSQKVETTLDTGDLPASQTWHPFRPVTRPVDGTQEATDQTCPDYSFDRVDPADPMADRLVVRLRSVS